tara:strand:- start:32415 stop:32804 length:390 start_codon:yes stop_codon:yes gene_type:complete
MIYTFPENFFYADTHEYVYQYQDLVRLGISQFAVDQLGDIVFIDLVDVGSLLNKGDTFGTVESVKAVEEVFSPFSAEVIERNDQLIDNPEILQNDPNEKGWLLVIKPLAIDCFNNLMNSKQYSEKVSPN